MATTKIACVQMNVEIGNVALNLGRVIDHINEAAEQGARLVIFPECALTGYCFTSLEEAKPYAEPVGGRSAGAITDACRRAGVHAVVGYIEMSGEICYNAAMLVGPEGLAGNYRKVHLPYLGVDRFLTPGDRRFEIFDLPFGRVGINICYDASFPEAARSLKLLGAQLIILPTNWPTGAWRTAEFLVNARAHENHLNFAAVNRAGVERGWQFIGRSKVIDYNGDTIVEGPRDEEMVITAEVDLAASDNNHIVNVAGSYEIDRLRDRRPEFYSLITEAVTQAGAAGLESSERGSAKP
jgi:predicted amidohydrolase